MALLNKNITLALGAIFFMCVFVHGEGSDDLTELKQIELLLHTGLYLGSNAITHFFNPGSTFIRDDNSNRLALHSALKSLSNLFLYQKTLNQSLDVYDEEDATVAVLNKVVNDTCDWVSSLKRLFFKGELFFNHNYLFCSLHWLLVKISPVQKLKSKA